MVKRWETSSNSLRRVSSMTLGRDASIWTQTGMNTSGEPFSFSFDNDRDDQDSIINLMKQAQVEGWKLKIRYHEVWGFKNVFYNRGETNYFVDGVTVLDKDFANPLRQLGQQQGRVVDTIFVVIDKQELLKRNK